MENNLELLVEPKSIRTDGAKKPVPKKAPLAHAFLTEALDPTGIIFPTLCKFNRNIDRFQRLDYRKYWQLGVFSGV